MNAAALAALADGPATPQGVKVEASTLSVDTHLQWQPNTEPDLAGYEIVYRDTTDPQWSHVIHVGNVTSYTVNGITKDNYIRRSDLNAARTPPSLESPGCSHAAK